MRNVFVSYSHSKDQGAADYFRNYFAVLDNVFIDKSIRHDIGELEEETIKNHLRDLIRKSSVTLLLIGQDTGKRWWVDWEIYNSLRKGEGKERNGLLGILIDGISNHNIPQRLRDNMHMAVVSRWPKDINHLDRLIEEAYEKRFNEPDLSRELLTRNLS